jgi:methyl-accepting chemotaxis protein
MNDMAKEIAKSKGKQFFDKFRGQLKLFISREASLLDKRNKEMEKIKAGSSTNVSEMNDALQWINHTYKVIQDAMKIEAAAVDMETGMRGYLLAGKEEFLEPYNNGSKIFLSLVTKLQKTVSDNPAQVKLLGEVSQVIGQWKEQIAEKYINTRRSVLEGKEKIGKITEMVGAAKGKEFFDKFRALIATFISREAALLDSRIEVSSTSRSKLDKNLAGLTDSINWVSHTYKVIQHAMKIEAAAVDMETGMRGYLLAGREEFLEPYNSGSKSFYALIKDLQTTVSDNPPQVKLLKETSQTITDWVENVVNANIQLRRDIGDSKTMDDMADLVAQKKGKVYFDAFRKLIKEFIDMEAGLMVKRSEESLSASSNAKNVIFGGVGFVILCSVIISVLLIKSITGPLKLVENRVSKLDEGDLLSSLNIKSNDEIGNLSRTLNSSVSNLGTAIKLTQGSAETLSSQSESIAATTTELSSTMENMNGQTNSVAAAVEELTVNMADVSEQAGHMYQETIDSKKSSQQVSESMEGISTSLDQAKNNLGAIAAASVEMTSVITEIASNTEKSRCASESAVGVVDKATNKVTSLSKSTDEIVAIIETISDISEQTKTLALNATIEAARAGEAGKGFAVVASEVKNLAKHTSDATLDISSKIQTMKEATDSTVEEISSIKDVITEINNMINNVASAIEEQSIALRDNSQNTESTNELIVEIFQNIKNSISEVQSINEKINSIETSAGHVAKTIEQAQQATSEVSSNVVLVDLGIKDTSDAVLELSKNAGELSSMSGGLKESVAKFQTAG